MSQKSEKYARNLERRMDNLEARQLDSNTYTALLHTIQEQSDRGAERWRKRAREAEHEARMWRLLCRMWLAVCVLVVVLAVLTTRADGTEAGVEAGPVVQVIPAPLEEEPENERIEAALLARAQVIEDCTVTHYDCCVECCGKTDGITASGVRATPGVTVAVDPDVIPLGADVLVDYGDGELHYMRADDTGAAVNGNHIDVCCTDHETALALGVRTATVWWASP